MVLVNFRGSLGFGEDSIQSLPGHIGTNDVLDCMACLEAAAQTGTLFLTFAWAAQLPDTRVLCVELLKAVCTCACACIHNFAVLKSALVHFYSILQSK